MYYVLYIILCIIHVLCIIWRVFQIAEIKENRLLFNKNVNVNVCTPVLLTPMRASASLANNESISR